MLKKNQAAGIQYMGQDGITESCKRAVIKLIHFGDKIENVKILTAEGDNSNSHALLIALEYGELIAIKAGFSSGYPGEGPRGYQFVLNLLNECTENINEYITPTDIFVRVADSSLTIDDIEKIEDLKEVRPARWRDFIPYMRSERENVYGRFPLVIPMALLDPRLIEIALDFLKNPDSAILNGYRKIESIVRKRTGLINESSSKLFSKAFQGDDSVLCWESLDSGECKGRASLFVSTFMAYRNRRAHQEPKHSLDDDIREFLLINQLFVLEREAVLRADMTNS